ncbi:MAG: radical SAM protein [Magnetococcales bacterium]|nr:radical SAM protein [Magnetococcales bacterium]
MTKKRSSFSMMWSTANNFLLSGLRNSKPTLIFRILKGFFDVRVRHQHKIQYIEIMSTHACNAKCDFCSNEFYDRRPRKQLLSRARIEGLIREAAAMDIPAVSFLGGEPLLDPNLFHYLDYTYQNGMMGRVNTNGQLLTDENLRKLKNSHVSKIMVSISSTDSQINDTITHVDGYLEKALSGIRRGKAMGISMGLKVVVNQKHFDSGEIKKFIDLANELKVNISFNPVVPTGAAFENYLDHTLNAEFQEKLDKLVEGNTTISTHLTNNYFGYGCPAGRAYLGITAYGDVIPCFFMPISYGNVWEMTLEEIHKRVLRTPLFNKGAETCVAAYDQNFINKIIIPIFTDTRLNSHIPVPIEKHPMYNPQSQILDI